MVYTTHAQWDQQQLEPDHAVPISCHSHNDYWRRVPIISALEAGCIGVEADVWAYGGHLLIGHTRESLSPDRTFSSLYIEPLVQLLQQTNGARSGTVHEKHAVGLFATDPTQTMVLLVDFKAAPDRIWPLFQRDLKALRDRGWLSYSQDGHVHMRPITIVVTGEIRRDAVIEEEISQCQDVFFDAPLRDLQGDFFHAQNSFWASSSFRRVVGHLFIGTLKDKHIETIRRDVNEAHSRGLKLRYWGLPGWPRSRRDTVWKALREEGVDIINVDDVKGAAGSGHLYRSPERATVA